jgi:hypothetical protein
MLRFVIKARAFFSGANFRVNKEPYSTPIMPYFHIFAGFFSDIEQFFAIKCALLRLIYVLWQQIKGPTCKCCSAFMFFFKLKTKVCTVFSSYLMNGSNRPEGLSLAGFSNLVGGYGLKTTLERSK